MRYSPAFFGLVFACALPRERERVLENLRRFCGRRGWIAERMDVVRTFVTYAHCLAESLALERPEAGEIAPLLHGREHLDAVLAAGRGAVVVTAHIGAWDATARWLGRNHSVEVLLVMAAEQDSDARALQDRIRVRGGVRIATVGRHPLDALPALGHLRRGGVVAVQLDRIADRESAVEVTLGDRPFAMPEGPFHLARLSGAPVLPVFARRLGYFHYEVSICRPIRVERNATPEGVERAASLAAEEMERFLRANPTQWFHFSE